MILILAHGDNTALNYGFGRAIETLCSGLYEIEAEYTFDSSDDFEVIVAQDFMNAEEAIKVKQDSGKPLVASIHLASSHPSEKLLLEAADGVIVYSKASKDHLLRLYPWLEVPVEIVRMGIDTEFWGESDAVAERGGNLLYAGRTSAANKNFNALVEKVITENIPFVHAGETSGMQQSLGYLDMAAMREQYRRAWLHILPSTYEPLGLVTMEAMACGCPVAVSSKAGVAEYLNDSVAIFFDPENFNLTDLMNRARGINRQHIAQYAKQFTEKMHAADFVASVERLRHYACVIREIRTGTYDKFNITGLDVVDIGAYMGETAIHFLSKGARMVYAIEPFESIKYIPHRKDIIPLRRAVTRTQAPYIFVENGFKNNGATRVSNHTASNGNCTFVPVLSLSQLPIIDGVLKVDCEGDEDFILDIAHDVLRRYKYMMIEAHHAIKPGIGFQIASYLDTNGFAVSLERHTPTEMMLYAERI